jgi:hypothetical protein
MRFILRVSISLSLIFLNFLNSCESFAQTKVQAQFLDGFEDPLIKSKLDSAINMMECVVNSKTFKKKVGRASIPFLDNGKSSKQILQLIKLGQEENTTADSIINLNLSTYDTHKREQGYIDSLNTIHINRRFIYADKVSSLAEYLLYEYMRTLGFRQLKRPWFMRVQAVPGKMETIFRKVLKVECFE